MGTDRRLIVALDVPSLDEARRLVAALGEAVGFYKLGMWLLFQPGVHDFAAELTAAGHELFLDYKLYDIAETVRAGARAIAARPARFLTVHGDRPILDAAVAGAAGRLGVLAVTVLTSLDAAGLLAMGYADDLPSLSLRRAREAAASGCAGIIASAADDLAALRGDSSLLVVTPGIRLPGGDPGDQRRIATPAEALRRGADYIVVGRPVTRADKPREAVERILENMARA